MMSQTMRSMSPSRARASPLVPLRATSTSNVSIRRLIAMMSATVCSSSMIRIRSGTVVSDRSGLRRLPRLGQQGDGEDHAGALPLGALHPDAAAVRFYDGLGHEETQARAPYPSALGLAAPVVLL